jgi:hypothetical protein
LPTYAQWADFRGDWTINSKNQFFVRYNYFRNPLSIQHQWFPQPAIHSTPMVGGLYTLNAAADFQDRAHIIGAQLVPTLSPTLLNEFRGSWPYRNDIKSLTHLPGPALWSPS